MTRLYRPFSLAMLAAAAVLAGSHCLAQQPARSDAVRRSSQNALTGTLQTASEIWIAARTDGQAGTGIASDPLDGSTQEKLDGLLIGLNKAGVKNITIHLGPGTFQTLGSTEWRNGADWRDGCTGWHLSDGWKIFGAGIGNTTIQLAGVCRDRDVMYDRLDVSVREGLWETPQPAASAGMWDAPEMWRAVKLMDGKNLKGLELGKVYYVAQVVDARHFRVSATQGGPVLAEAGIASGGWCRRISKVSCAGMSNEIITGRGVDMEVRDLGLDCNWPSFGTVVAEDFTMPAELKTVVVKVDSVAWARPVVGLWVNLTTPGNAVKSPGHFEIVRVVDDTHLELKNVQGFRSLGGIACADQGTINAAPDSAVPKGTRMGPEMITCALYLIGDRARVERVHVRNLAGTWYEGSVGIMIGHYFGPVCHDMIVRDCVTSDAWGAQNSGIFIECGAIGEGPRPASKPLDGAQGLIENNTIYGNGAGACGLSAGGAVRTMLRNNRVYNIRTGFYVEGPINDFTLQDNVFSNCAGCAIGMNATGYFWDKDKAYKVRDTAIVNDVEYLAKAQNTGQPPPNEQFWERTHAWLGNVTVEGNVIEVCDHASGIQVMGNADTLTVRRNVIRRALGQTGEAALGLMLADKTNRHIIITDNIIDSRLTNSAGKGLVLGRDNLDETGKLLRDLEAGEHAPVRTKPLPPNLGALTPASDLQQPAKSADPLVADLGSKGEIQNWLVLGPFPHPPATMPDSTKLGMGYDFDFLSAVGGEDKISPKTGQSVMVKFPAGPDARTFWKKELLPRRIVWHRVAAANCPGDNLNERAARREWVDLLPLMEMGPDADYVCAYAYCVLHAEKACQVSLSLGSDDGYVLFVNGQREGELRNDRRSYAHDSNAHKVALHAGDNTVLLKACNALGTFGFGVRVISAEFADAAIPGGKPATGIKVVLP